MQFQQINLEILLLNLAITTKLIWQLLRQSPPLCLHLVDPHFFSPPLPHWINSDDAPVATT
jgi:hypothetical protein